MNKREIKKLLIGAKRVLEDKGWTQKAMARNEFGWKVEVLDGGGYSFCILGAMAESSGSLAFIMERKIEEILLNPRVLPHEFRSKRPALIAAVNDSEGMTKEKVIRWIERGIRRLG